MANVALTIEETANSTALTEELWDHATETQTQTEMEMETLAPHSTTLVAKSGQEQGKIFSKFMGREIFFLISNFDECLEEKRKKTKLIQVRGQRKLKNLIHIGGKKKIHIKTNHKKIILFFYKCILEKNKSKTQKNHGEKIKFKCDVGASTGKIK